MYSCSESESEEFVVVGEEDALLAPEADHLDYCGAHDITCEIDVIPAKDVNRSMVDLAANKNGARRFVIDIANTLDGGTVVDEDKRINPRDWEILGNVIPKSANVHANLK